MTTIELKEQVRKVNQSLMKIGSYMHLSEVSQVCSNQVCMTFFHRIMLMSLLVVM